MYKDIADKLVKWIYNKVKNAHGRGCMIGLSGGVDSAATAALCREAFPNSTLGIHILCHGLAADAQDAQMVAEVLGIEYKVVDLHGVYDLLVQTLASAADKPEDFQRLILSNLKPRLRMTVLYYYAQLNQALVIGTANRSELAVGYFTKHGDGAVDLLPLGNLLKTQVWELAKYLGIPSSIINKAPSAGFWPGQTDERDMGFSYHQLDRILTSGGGDLRIRAMIDRRRIINEHKMKMPPIPRIKAPSAL